MCFPNRAEKGWLWVAPSPAVAGPVGQRASSGPASQAEGTGTSSLSHPSCPCRLLASGGELGSSPAFLCGLGPAPSPSGPQFPHSSNEVVSPWLALLLDTEETRGKSV